MSLPALNINVKINNTVYEFQRPLTIFQACLSKNIFIPRFCYHVALKIAGNCRMCLVEEKSSLKPVASCAVSSLTGQTIHTNTEIVKRAREGVLEYLLANHPLDCPICDQGGECDLQDQSIVFGADRGRFYESKRSTPNKNLGFLIKTFLNRCIHCARCTRYLADVAGAPDIQLLGRGYKTEISTYVRSFVKSEISGNIIDLCPVGALTSKPYAYRARPWELSCVYSFDLLDSLGSSIQLDFRGLELLRILPRANKFLNEEWISDRTRFCYDAFNCQRLTSPTFYTKNNFVKISWLEFLNFYKNLNFFQNTVSRNLNLTASFGDFVDLETALELKTLSGKLGSALFPNIEMPHDQADFRANYVLKNLQVLGAGNSDLEDYKIFLFNLNLRYESPILNIKVRRAFVDFSAEIIVIGFLSNFNYDYQHFSRTIKMEALNYFRSVHSKLHITRLNPLRQNFGLHIPNSYTTLSCAEMGLVSKWVGTRDGLSELRIGQPEGQTSESTRFWTLHFLHHMENNYLHNLRSRFSAFLPTRFYFEKVCSYFNSSYNFFKTSYHFTYKLPQTKEDYKILAALYKLFVREDTRGQLSWNSTLTSETPANNFFKIKPTTTFINVGQIYSVVNNFYGNSVICRTSLILNLCSNKMVQYNDYVYSSII